MTDSNEAGPSGLQLAVGRKRILNISSSSDEDEPPIIRRRIQSDIIESSGSSVTTTSRAMIDATDFINALTGRSKPIFSMQQMLNAIPEFDPDSRAQNIDIWLRKVNECALIYEWTDRQTSHCATQRLRGTAKSWYNSQPSLDFSCIEWQQKLRRAFPVDDNFALLLEEMFGRKTDPEESLRSYFYDKLMLLNRCGITGKKAVDCLIHGITNTSLRNSATALKCQEPEDLLHYFVLQQPQGVLISQTQRKRGYTTRFENSISQKKAKCYYCGIEGHMANKCFKRNKKPSTDIKKVCFNCNEEGHLVANCPKAANKSK
ncbi:uncharacterized protein LOC134805922 [Cydia splendana]|uniref:uncharacterized protein LOC134805922 n=1 Tax=Cydia splendana TaxID=1100963 RepID=UPI00300D8F00